MDTISYIYFAYFAPESIRSKKKVSLHSTFHVGSRTGDPGLKNVWIRDEKMVGSGIKHPGSATLT
jgi:hypothetical protein